ncbi:glycosyltransferase [Desulforhopalus sp. IMCC35007]|uniref:glycosyltransferase n=1 Tax=Desulforhopalus sp. IMCC35007 TaxID=2569543 RepID=UPI0010ADCE3A|nr:glycosyltransferase [Desulforhopalus sp. IMCC35007]TKB08332.1 glycosyltransferase [Desulforhopalus sp. IMCC35007]
MNIKKAVLVFLRVCINKEYRQLRLLGVFDSGYYLSLQERLTGDQGDTLDPLWTYVKTALTAVQQDSRGAGDWSQQADPHPLFDTSYYLLRYFPEGLQENPFLHYLSSGWKHGFCPGPFFDPDIYGSWSGWRAEDGNPLCHYIRLGQQQGKSPSLNFDFQFYFDTNPILAGLKNEIIKHYKLHGASIGKSPLPLFDPEFYLGSLALSGLGKTPVLDPLSHYLCRAKEEGARPAACFDPEFYLDQCGAGISKGEALCHYVTKGVFDQLYCCRRVAELKDKPLISLLVPVYNPDPAVLRNCIRSVLYQAYPHWELCLADDCSPRPEVRVLLQEWSEKDTRIKVTFLSENNGIAGATNSAATLATGSYVGFLDNDDELTVDCLLKVVEELNASGADLLYSDEDLIGNDGTVLSVFRKPGFNQALLFSHNYITHFVTVKKSLFEKVGGLDALYDGAQDYDLLLKLTEQCERVVHIPEILYHWRASETSTSINHGQKNYANEAGRKALEAAMVRRQIPLGALHTELNFFYQLRACRKVEPSVSVIIWGADAGECHQNLVSTLIEGSGAAYPEYILVSTKRAASEKLNQRVAIADVQVRVVSCPPAEGIASALNRVIGQLESEFVVLIDGTAQAMSHDWLEGLTSPFLLEDVAMVCGRVNFDGSDGPSYLYPQLSNEDALYFHDFLQSSTRHMAGLHCLQDVSYGNWQLAMFRREEYLDLGGFLAQEFPHLFAMADFSCRLVESGKRIIYTPYASLVKTSISSLPLTDDVEGLIAEKAWFQQKLRDRKISFDPYYSKGLLADHKIDEASFLGWLEGQKQSG